MDSLGKTTLALFLTLTLLLSSLLLVLLNYTTFHFWPQAHSTPLPNHIPMQRLSG